MRQIILIANDMRSTFNVGSLFRTAEGLGVKKLYLTGYTAYPKLKNDPRLPHISKKLTDQIHKTALGAETVLDWEYCSDTLTLLARLQIEGFTVAALEQSSRSVDILKFNPPNKVALLLGNEVSGIPEVILDKIPIHLSIPMSGYKESYNVVISAAMALFQLRFH